MTLSDKVKSMTDIARAHVEDGAFRSAARVLRDLAAVLDAHVKTSDPAFRPTRHIDAGPDSFGERKK